MGRHKKNYTQGSVFAVPLRDGGFGLGVVARSSRGGITLGYFFGPRRDELPGSDVATLLNPADVLLIRLFGDLGLLRGEWPVLGRIPDWKSEDWPVPFFVRVNYADPRQSRLVEYDPVNLGVVAKAHSIGDDRLDDYFEDGMSGYGALEVQLTNLLRS